jgi:hypothetical protein
MCHPIAGSQRLPRWVSAAMAANASQSAQQGRKMKCFNELDCCKHA